MLVAGNYHYIRPSFETPYPGIFGVTPSQFENQLKRLDKIGNFVGAADIVKAIDNDVELPNNAILITFDDGLKEQYEIALPILDKMGIPAVFYINTYNIHEKKISSVHKLHLLLSNLPFGKYQSYIYSKAGQLYGKYIELADKGKALKHYNYDTEDRAVLKYFLNFCLDFEEQSFITDSLFKETFSENESHLCEELYLSRDNIIKLGEMGYLGSHSHRHIPLGLCSLTTADEDIKTSIKIIEDITGEVPCSISYPFGSLESSGEAVQKLAKGIGFKFGFTMERAGNFNLDQSLGLSRFDCNDLPGGKSALFKDQDFFAGISTSKWFY